MPARRTPQRQKPNRSVERMSISDGDGSDFTEETEEEEEEEEEDEDDEGGGDEDRGDDVGDDPEDEEDQEDEEDPDEEEEDPDEEEEEDEDDPDSEEEDEEEEDEEDDPSEEDLHDLANGGTVPLGRLNQVLEQNRQLTEAVLAMTTGGGTKPKKDDEPAFDLAAKIRERNKFLIDGDEDKAAALDLEIEAHRTAVATAAAEERATANVTGALAKQAIESAVKTVRTTFPVLDPKSKKFNEDTNDSVRGIANVLESKGWSSAEAIIEAARRVCDPTGELTGAGKRTAKAKKSAAKETQEKARKGKDTRTQRERLRDLQRSKRNPPSTARAGVANRQSVDADENDDPSSITEGRVRRMSEQEKRVARGDYVGTKPRGKQRGR